MNGNGMEEGVTNIGGVGFPYYYGTGKSSYSNGPTPYQVSSTSWQCVDTSHPKGINFYEGYSQGTWLAYKKGTEVNPDEDKVACTQVDATQLSAQLVLPFEFSTNLMIEGQVRALEDGTVGIRFLVPGNTKGRVGNGYLFVLDFDRKWVRLLHEVDGVSSEVAPSQPMSDALISLSREKYILRVNLIGGKVTCYVDENSYFRNINVNIPVDGGAIGLYANGCKMRAYRLTIASLDRWEQQERVQVQVDNIVFPIWGEVPRNVGKDRNGLLMFTGVPGVIKAAVDDVEKDAQGLFIDDDGTKYLNTANRAGTIFSTETRVEDWSQDFKNIPVQTLPGLTEGRHTIKIHMIDSGFWVRTMYLGDAQGFSVAYNSDRIGFIRTSKLVEQYGCKGIAMWTLGQEDPTVFNYIPDSR
jgi:spore germination protein YaaH